MVRLTRCWHENFEIHDWANIVTQPTELLPLPAVNLHGTPGQVLSTHLRVSRAQACVLRTDTVWLPVLEGMVSRVSSHPNKTCLVAIPQFSSSTNLGLACSESHSNESQSTCVTLLAWLRMCRPRG